MDSLEQQPKSSVNPCKHCGRMPLVLVATYKWGKKDKSIFCINQDCPGKVKPKPVDLVEEKWNRENPTQPDSSKDWPSQVSRYGELDLGDG